MRSPRRLIDVPPLPLPTLSHEMWQRYRTSTTVVEKLVWYERWRAQGEWVPAAGGTEVPVQTQSGRRLLYCYQPRSGRHAYLDLDTDLILTDAEAWEAFGP